MKDRIPTITVRGKVTKLFIKPFYIITPEERKRQMAERGYCQPAVHKPQEGYELHPAFKQVALRESARGGM